MRVLEHGRVSPVPTETAIIVPIPEAEPIVGEHRRRFDQAALWGVPAHVTVLYPFVDPRAVDARVLTTLGAVAQSIVAFTCTFARTGWFARDVLWLAPDPAEPFRQLTAAAWAAFPEYPPYAGAYDDVVPHLTVAEARSDASAELELVERTLQGDLPVLTGVDSLVLMAGTTQPDSWHVLAEFPLRMRRDRASP